VKKIVTNAYDKVKKNTYSKRCDIILKKTMWLNIFIKKPNLLD
jgi:hypothetical protein